MPSNKDLLYQALASPLGIVIKTTDPRGLRDSLRSYVRLLPEFSELSFVRSPASPSDELWIINRGAIEDGTWKDRLNEVLNAGKEPEPSESDS